jgi:hypothetical protein
MSTIERHRLREALRTWLVALFIAALLGTTVAIEEVESAERTTTARATRDVPNLQGIWTGGTLTAFERPPQYAGKPFLSAAEIAEHNRQTVDTFWAAGHRQGDVGRDNDAFIDNHLGILPSGQTSLVVEPADGLVPLRPEAEARRNFNLKNVDSYETMSQWDRCITREPMSMLPFPYNSAYQIIQTPSHIVMMAEMIHDARIIPLDGRPHADARVKSWGGDSRGHWEGRTLVVDTTNFNGKGWITTGMNTGRIRGIPASEELHVIERFTLIDPQTLTYEIIVEDPQVYTAPWKVSVPLKRDDSYRMFEYACHEGNSAIELILRGARVQEAQAK